MKHYSQQELMDRAEEAVRQCFRATPFVCLESITVLPYSEGDDLLRVVLRLPGLERIAKSPRALLETLTTPVTYESRNADEILASLGVPACPPLESYVDKLVEYVKEHVKRRRAVKAEEEAAATEVEDPLV